jgi:diguanylate cyclase (GGDEF)-like protein/PAS domain S-box-containing protein
MNLKPRIWLSLALLTAIVLSVDLTISYYSLNTALQAELEQDARTLYGYMMATRRIYQEQFIASELPVTDHTVGFLPAHAMPLISRDFRNWNTEGIRFNNVSDRPRNPENRADRFERTAMDWFRANPGQDRRLERIADDDGASYMLFTAPIRIERLCLRCHGDAESAPAGIRAAYSEAFDYRLGDLRGLVSIRIPTARVDTRFRNLWLQEVLTSLAGYALLFAGLGLLLEHRVLRRLARLRTGAERIAAGEYETRVAMDRPGQDEICGLARAFNHMAGEVQQRTRTLGQLSLAVEQSPESIVITDLSGHIEYVNAACLANTGYTREELIGHNPRVLKSGRTPPETYHNLWTSLLAGQVWRGQLVNRRKDGRELIEAVTIAPLRGPDHRVTHYVAVKQDITEQTRARQEIERLAYHDPLTDLPNRTLLLDRLTLNLAVARRQGRYDALILCNLDRFKNFNAARGHDLGDALLLAVGRRLSGLLREGDTLARLGGDEFALLLPDLAREAEPAGRSALTVAERIHEELRRPFRLDGEETTLSASLGIALCPEDHQDSPKEVLRRADTALHRAKESGGSASAFFDPAMGESARRRFRVERELRQAIAAGDLRLYLQPQVDGRGALTGAEALVRWQHPERGLLPPGMFVPVAEESDLIVDLGAWVLVECCHLIAGQAAAGHSLRLSANLSPRQFRQTGFVPWFKDLLAATGADPTALTLEVTEGLVIDNINDAVARMTELASLGVHFSIDDFGTGYSSLAYLKRLPIQELKIDRSFVQDAPTDPNDAALVETILAVARHLGLRVVAEGVETEAQAMFLNARAEVTHQGYLYGRPEPAAQWLARWFGEATGG